MNANMLQVTTPQSRLPELIAAVGERASMRFPEFFAANIRNPHTRTAYFGHRRKQRLLAGKMAIGSHRRYLGPPRRGPLRQPGNTGLRQNLQGRAD
jgi:hypothetical protein